MTSGTDTAAERKMFLRICASVVVALTIIAVMAIFHGVDNGGATLVGVIVGGLITFGKDIIAAVRSYSMAASLQRVTDQVAAAAPVAAKAPGAPAGTADDPTHVTVDDQPVETRNVGPS